MLPGHFPTGPYKLSIVLAIELSGSGKRITSPLAKEPQRLCLDRPKCRTKIKRERQRIYERPTTNKKQ